MLILLLGSSAAFAQPVWSPSVRADREVQWMTDSLNITPEQATQLKVISLNYNTRYDKASTSKSKDKVRKMLMSRKDADIKKILNKEQYAHYYRREKQIREIEKNKITTGPHRPY